MHWKDSGFGVQSGWALSPPLACYVTVSQQPDLLSLRLCNGNNNSCFQCGDLPVLSPFAKYLCLERENRDSRVMIRTIS